MIDHERRKEIQTANDLVFTAYYGDAVYAMRSFMGDNRARKRLVDVHRQTCVPDLCVYDR